MPRPQTIYMACFTVAAALVWSASPQAATQQEPDSDHDGLSDFAEVHKYFTDPHKPTTAEDRKESTYTITSVMQFAKPFNVADMTDDYQDARVIAQDEDSVTVEIVYYPLNTNRDAIGENPNWKRDYSGMTQYLAPTATENWDEKMRADLIAQLRADGIDPDRLTDKALVTQVSTWLMRRSRYNKAFVIWYVHYPNGAPEVFPSLRKFFDKEKPSPETTDQSMFDQEVLGRQMFYNKVHGSCTSSSIYMATVMRALGIPTRIIYCDPPADVNDKQQREMLLAAIHHNAVRADIRHGLPGGGGDFSNHLFNEVYVGNRWVRLNYDNLGQNILDPVYFGLLTHILTTDSVSHVPMAETWGSRYAMYAEATPKLSSMNPYRLLKVSDHFGVNSHIANPEVDYEELRRVTISETYWKGALPASIASAQNDPTGSDFYLGIDEYVPHYRLQMREFASHAGHDFVLSAAGHPDLKAALSGMKFSTGDATPRHQLFGVRIEPEFRALLAPGVAYEIKPANTSGVYVWTVKGGVKLGPPAGGVTETTAVTEFEVASVKPNKSKDGHSDVGFSSNKEAVKLTMVNVSLLRCLQIAYGVKAYQIIGPDWMKSESFDIIATVPANVPKERVWLMLRKLLADRFQVAIRRETKMLPIYELVAGKNGPKITAVEAVGGDQTGTWDSVGKLTGKKVAMPDFAGVLSRIVDRPVIDKTGLAGVFDFTVEYSRDDGSAPQAAGETPSIFTALQETLGLKLEPAKGPVEILVVDNAVRVPSGN